jgi:hypothetical protein
MNQMKKEIESLLKDRAFMEEQTKIHYRNYKNSKDLLNKPENKTLTNHLKHFEYCAVLEIFMKEEKR